MTLHRWPWLLPLAALVMGSCKDNPASEIVVLLSGDLSTGDPTTNTPSDIDSIEFSGTRGGSDISALYGVGRGQEIRYFPATTVLYNRDDELESGTVGTLTIKGVREGDSLDAPALLQAFSFSLPDRETRLMRVPLQMACLGMTCLNGGMCVDGVCQDPYALDPRALPLYSEATDPAKHPDLCTNITTKGCFASARRYPAAAMLPITVIDSNPPEPERCVVQIDDSDLTTDDLQAINVAVVWAEARGRYSVLDRFNKVEPSTPWRGVSGSWDITRPPGQSYALLNLPVGVCRQSPLGGKSRVVDIIVSKGEAASCSSKSPSREACDHAPSEATVGDDACVIPKKQEGKGCLACALKQISDQPTLCKTPGSCADLLACSNDDRCRQVVTCLAACQSLNPNASCAEACTASSCIPAETAKKAKSVAELLQNGVAECKKSDKESRCGS